MKDAARVFIFAIAHASEIKGQFCNVRHENINMTKSQAAEVARQNVEICNITESNCGKVKE